MKRLITLISSVMFAAYVLADITVSGVVVSQEDSEPVIGASVLEKGTNNGTITEIKNGTKLVK